MNFSKYVSYLLNEAVARHNGNTSEAASELGINYGTFWAWVKGDRRPSIDQLSFLFDKMGIDFQPTPPKVDKPLLINVQTVASDQESYVAYRDNYIAVPLVREENAGRALPPREKISTWYPIYKSHKALKFRTNIIAVAVAESSIALQPVVNPDDIVLVDLDDRVVEDHGGIWLAVNPDGEVMIRRAAMLDSVVVYKNKKMRIKSDAILFYSDSAHEVYSLDRDYAGKSINAIIGRVFWKCGALEPLK